jgi:hypothetical protein
LLALVVSKAFKVLLARRGKRAFRDLSVQRVLVVLLDFRDLLGQKETKETPER